MKKNRICPVERAGSLDNRFRRWLQDPQKIVGPFVKEHMTVVDLGCGPGFFSVDMAQMVGEHGRVIAADVQDGMLQRLRAKIKGTVLEKRIVLHKCKNGKIGIAAQVDFILAFYMVHEIPDKGCFFTEIESILKPDALLLMVEPPFHVSSKTFNQTLEIARAAGLIVNERPRILLSKAVLMKKG